LTYIDNYINTYGGDVIQALAYGKVVENFCGAGGVEDGRFF